MYQKKKSFLFNFVDKNMIIFLSTLSFHNSFYTFSGYFFWIFLDYRLSMCFESGGKHLQQIKQ